MIYQVLFYSLIGAILLSFVFILFLMHTSKGTEEYKEPVTFIITKDQEESELLLDILLELDQTGCELN